MRFQLKQSVVLTASAIVVAFAGPVWGDRQNTAQRAGNSQPASVSNAPPAKAAVSAADIYASRLIGMEVRDRSGEHIGEIEDIIVDLSDDRMRYAVVAAGGFLGIGERHYVYSMNRFSKALTGDELVLNAESLSGAPSFGGDWPDFNDQEYQARLDGTSGGETTRVGETDLRRVSKLLGIDVRNSSGVPVGELQDFVIELQSGEARAMVTFDPGENADERLVAVPPNRLGIPRYSLVAVINMTWSELMNAPRLPD